MSKKIVTLCSLVLLAAASAVAHADTIQFSTAVGANAGSGPVDAYATITTGLNSITITLHDLEADPGNVGQVLSGFQFVLSDGKTSGTLTSSSSKEITINSNKTSTVGGTVSTGWGLNDNVNGGMQLDVLGFAGPEHLLIGPGPYTNSNSSIAGNGPHNPFLDQTATFNLTVMGITANTSVLSTQFTFGTTVGTGCVTGFLMPVTPEPSSLVLLGTGVLGLAGAMRRRMMASKQA